MSLGDNEARHWSRHSELSVLYPDHFMDLGLLPCYDLESTWQDGERNADYFVDPFVWSYDRDFLEVGCGLGGLSAVLNSRGGRAVGIDLADFTEEWKGYRHEFPNLEYIRGDFLSYDWGDRQFDFIVSIGTWEHLDDPIRGLRRAYSLLREGGVFSAHIGMYFSRRGSHLYRILNYPHPNLFFDDICLEEIIDEPVPFVNTMTCSHYRDFCERIGFRTLLWQETQEPYEAELIRRYPKILGKYPVEDLEIPLLNVLLWKPYHDEPPSYFELPIVIRGTPSDWRQRLPPLVPHLVDVRYNVAQSLLARAGASGARWRVLDIGAGNGHAASCFARRGCFTVATDPQEDNIKKAVAEVGGMVRVLERPLPESLHEIPAGSFELIICSAKALDATGTSGAFRAVTMLANLCAPGGITIVDGAGGLGAEACARLRHAGFATVYDGPTIKRLTGTAYLGPEIAILIKGP